jgi:hypothetical protein
MDKKNKQKEVINISFLTVEEHKELHSNNLWAQRKERGGDYERGRIETQT